MDGSGAVTASSSAAAEAGAAILRQGGNAVDAAVATALASCVADGCNTGLGGYGGHMVVAVPGENPISIDFNMWVPRRAAERYQRRSLTGPAASVVPNVVAGLERALSEKGSLDWATVSAPAIHLAAGGVEPNQTTHSAFEQCKSAPFLGECFAFERSPIGGERFRQPALARTLEQMATNGARWFYDGPIGETAIAILRNAGHDLNAADWRRAPDAVAVAPAPRLAISGATLFSAPLGTSGSLSMFAAVAAGAALAREQPLDTAEAVLAWAQAIASSWCYRFGTRDGNIVAEAGLEAWIERALSFDQPTSLGAGAGHTSHLNAVDGNGTIVAMTLTHGPAWFGARWVLPDTGIIMNAGAALLANGPLKLVDERAYAVTNMAPTIVCADDGAVLAAGCPGARRIPSITGLVLARHLFGGLSLQEAVSRGRFHAEARELATIEAGRWDPSVGLMLKRAFQNVELEGTEHYYGPFTAIRRELGGAIGFGLDDRLPGYKAFAGTG